MTYGIGARMVFVFELYYEDRRCDTLVLCTPNTVGLFPFFSTIPVLLL